MAEIRQDRSLERVAAILRNEIELKPRADGFGCQPSYHLNDDFLRELRIDGAVQIAGALRDCVHHPVAHLDADVGVMNRELLRLFAFHSADVLGGQRIWICTRQQRRSGPRVLPQRKRFQRIPVEDLLLHRAVDIDNRRRSRNGDRLFQCSDAEIRIDGGGKSRRHFDALTPNRLEPGQRECHGIDAWPQVDHAVDARAVRDDGAYPLNQRWTGGFHRHARKHGARRIAHHARDIAARDVLCRRRAWPQQHRRSDDADKSAPMHDASPARKSGLVVRGESAARSRQMVAFGASMVCRTPLEPRRSLATSSW